MPNYYKGFYKIQNPKKYRGDPTECYYRSLWERKVCKFADLSPSVIEWCIEPFSIKYISPIDSRPHQYIIDFWMKVKTSDGKEEIQLIEVKPYKQTINPMTEEHTPSTKKRRPKTLAEQISTYAVNSAKWEAARKVCEAKNWKFIILTEKELFRETKKKSKR